MNPLINRKLQDDLHCNSSPKKQTENLHNRLTKLLSIQVIHERWSRLGALGCIIRDVLEKWVRVDFKEPVWFKARAQILSVRRRIGVLEQSPSGQRTERFGSEGFGFSREACKELEKGRSCSNFLFSNEYITPLKWAKVPNMFTK